MMEFPVKSASRRQLGRRRWQVRRSPEISAPIKTTPRESVRLCSADRYGEWFSQCTRRRGLEIVELRCPRHSISGGGGIRVRNISTASHRYLVVERDERPPIRSREIGRIFGSVPPGPAGESCWLMLVVPELSTGGLNVAGGLPGRSLPRHCGIDLQANWRWPRGDKVTSAVPRCGIS